MLLRSLWILAADVVAAAAAFVALAVGIVVVALVGAAAVTPCCLWSAFCLFLFIVDVVVAAVVACS